MDLKMEEVVGKVCQVVGVEALTPADAQKGARAVVRVEDRAKEQDGKDKVLWEL